MGSPPSTGAALVEHPPCTGYRGRSAFISIPDRKETGNTSNTPPLGSRSSGGPHRTQGHPIVPFFPNSGKEHTPRETIPLMLGTHSRRCQPPSISTPGCPDRTAAVRDAGYRVRVPGEGCRVSDGGTPQLARAGSASGRAAARTQSAHTAGVLGSLQLPTLGQSLPRPLGWFLEGGLDLAGWLRTPHEGQDGDGHPLPPSPGLEQLMSAPLLILPDLPGLTSPSPAAQEGILLLTANSCDLPQEGRINAFLAPPAPARLNTPEPRSRRSRMAGMQSKSPEVTVMDKHNTAGTSGHLLC